MPFENCLVAIVTPMHDDGAPDYEAWARLIELHVASGTAGIVVGGTTGESATLTDEELHALVVRAAGHARGRLALLAGTGGSSTAVTVARVRALSSLPVDGILAVTPAYNRPPQEGLYRHYAAIAAAAGKPVVLYNVPARTAVDLEPPTVARLAQLPGIVGIKEAVADPARIAALVAACPPRFRILSGDDGTARAAIAAGACGVISVTANVAPRAMAQMVAAARRGEAARAAELDAPLAGLHRALFVEANPIPVKWLLGDMGLIGPGIRLPLVPLAERFRDGVRGAARKAGVGVKCRSEA